MFEWSTTWMFIGNKRNRDRPLPPALCVCFKGHRSDITFWGLTKQLITSGLTCAAGIADLPTSEGQREFNLLASDAYNMVQPSPVGQNTNQRKKKNNMNLGHPDLLSVHQDAGHATPVAIAPPSLQNWWLPATSRLVTKLIPK